VRGGGEKGELRKGEAMTLTSEDLRRISRIQRDVSMTR